MATLTERILCGIGPESVADDVVTMAEITRFNDNYQAQLSQGAAETMPLVQLQSDELKTLSTFGRQAADGIGRVADALLAFVQGTAVGEADPVLMKLLELLGKLDPKPPRSFRQKIQQKILPATETDPASLLRYYDLLVPEIDKVYVLLKRRQNAIQQECQTLQNLYAANLSCYQTLEASIITGQATLEQWDKGQKKAESSDSPSLVAVEVRRQRQAQQMLILQLTDLQNAEKMALQNIVFLQRFQYSQYNLEHKIEAAATKTLPAFKHHLSQLASEQRLPHFAASDELSPTQLETLQKIHRAMLTSFNEVNAAQAEREQLLQAMSITNTTG